MTQLPEPAKIGDLVSVTIATTGGDRLKAASLGSRINAEFHPGDTVVVTVEYVGKGVPEHHKVRVSIFDQVSGSRPIFDLGMGGSVSVEIAASMYDQLVVIVADEVRPLDDTETPVSGVAHYTAFPRYTHNERAGIASADFTPVTREPEMFAVFLNPVQ